MYQIFVFDLVSTLLLCYFLTVRPMKDRINNLIQIFNEAVVLMCIQSMFLFTNYVGQAQTRYDMGQKVLYLLAGNILINLVVLVAELLKGVYKALRIWYLKRRNKINNDKAIIDRHMKNSKDLQLRMKRRIHLLIGEADASDKVKKRNKLKKVTFV